MALPLRPRAISQCSACLSSYAWPISVESSSTQWSSLRQQTRGKKKVAKNLGTVPARLLKDLPGFGKKGAYVPIAAGELRNNLFPRRIAEYVTQPELRTLKANNVPIERDYAFGQKDNGPAQPLMMPLSSDPTPNPVRRAPEVEKLSPEKSVDLLDIFVPHRLDFYRQEIVEDAPAEAVHPEAEKKELEKKQQDKKQRVASSAAMDLLAARTQAPKPKPKPRSTGAIFGSVSPHDILVAVRAAIARNDEAARVILTEEDITFMDQSVRDEGKIKFLGDFTVELKVKGAESGVKRTVRVIAQDPQ